MVSNRNKKKLDKLIETHTKSVQDKLVNKQTNIGINFNVDDKTKSIASNLLKSQLNQSSKSKPSKLLLEELLSIEVNLVDEKEASNNPIVRQDFISGEYLKFNSKLDLQIPSDQQNILNSPQDCLEILEALSPLARIILGLEFDHTLKFYLGDRLKWYKASDNNISREKILLEIKLKTLYLITKTARIANEFLIRSQFTLEEFKKLVESTRKEADLIKVTAINLTDLSEILEGISQVFPEFKVPEKNYDGIALVNPLNYMVGGVAMVSSSRALRDKDIWDKDLISGYAYYQHKKSDDANSIITHYISDITDTGKLTLLPHDQALQVLEKFGVYPTLLHLILAVHTYRKIDPTNTKIELTGTDLIKDLGLDKRKHLTKQEKFKRVLECLTAVKSLVISASWQSVVKFKEKGKWKKKDLPLYLPPTVMWNISELLIPQENSLGENEIKEIEIVVKAGAWLDHFFNRNGKSLGQALYNYATFAKSILDLDPYREELALRIALIQSTMDYRQYHTVEKWLIENLPNGKKRISDAKNDHRSRKKLKDSWDRNLLALERIGFKIDFDDKGSYPQELRPANESNPRGYWDKLLNGKIKITPPRLNKPESNNEKQERLEREAKKKLSSTKNYSGSELKQARESANVKPTAIAKYLDCSKGRIYNAEKRQSISPKIYKEIMDAINYIKKHPDKYQ